MTPEIVDRILDKVVNGSPLRRALREENISARSWYFALDTDTSVAERYARAKDHQIDAMADDMMDIADTTDDPQKGRLQVDTRKWLMSKLAPKKYGDRVTTETTGANGGPIVYQVTTGVPRGED